ncbi:hypothetical protein BD626DRAFT_494099 [Schizophyllum amplum]|uniref:Uncharacterized protein n=1 Tax=Schizophyllum amplum TaxID=97359 RepID=A0A550CEY2_9AGAR|nr:hypothetical protein BD626DRAFT_494099 [Auriculariopsis ampla]
MPTIRFRRAASCLLRSSASRLDLRLPHSCQFLSRPSSSDRIQDWAPGIRTYVKRQVLRAHIVYRRLEARIAITKSPSSLLYPCAFLGLRLRFFPSQHAWTLRSPSRGQVEQKENLKIRKPQIPIIVTSDSMQWPSVELSSPPERRRHHFDHSELCWLRLFPPDVELERSLPLSPTIEDQAPTLALSSLRA